MIWTWTTTELVVMILATWRLTRLVTTDRVTRKYRVWLIRWAYARHGEDLADDPGDVDETAAKDDEAPLPAYLVKCAWCAGAWVSIGWVLLAWANRDVWWWCSLAAAASGGLVIVNVIVDRLVK